MKTPIQNHLLSEEEREARKERLRARLAADAALSPRERRIVRRKTMSRSALVSEYLERQMYCRPGGNHLCPECRRLNAHGKGCSRPETISIGPLLRAPKASASIRTWKAFAALHGRLQPLLDVYKLNRETRS